MNDNKNWPDNGNLVVLRTLQHTHKPRHHATKTLIIKNGKPDKIDFSRSKLYHGEVHQIRDFQHLSQLLFELESDPYAFIVRGQFRESVDLTKPVYRRKYAPPNEPDTNHLKEPSGLPWICFDIDATNMPFTRLGYPASLTINDVEPQKCFDLMITKYAPELANVSYHYQFSASAGWTKPHALAAHLWFLLDRPMSNAECKRFVQFLNARAGDDVFDPALYQAAQPHYTARPVLGTGVQRDPMPKRSGVVLLEKNELSLPSIEFDRGPNKPRQSSTLKQKATKPLVALPENPKTLDGWIEAFETCKTNLHNLALSFWYWVHGQFFNTKQIEQINDRALQAIIKSPRCQNEPKRFDELTSEWEELNQSAWGKRASAIAHALKRFPSLPNCPQNESQIAYFKNKGILADWLPDSVRFDTEHAAIVLKNIETGTDCGIQKFYADAKIYELGTLVSGSYHLIGELTNDTSQVAFCKDFSTGLVLRFFWAIPIIVTLENWNFLRVCLKFRAKYPQIDGIVVCEDNCVLAGVYAAKAADYKYIIPQFDGNLKPQNPPRGIDWHIFKLNYIGNTTSRHNEASIYQAIRELVQSAIKLTPRLSFEKAKAQVTNAVKTFSDEHLKDFDKPCPKASELLAYVDIALKDAWENSLIGTSQKISGDYSERVGKWINFDLMKLDGKWRIPVDIANQIVSAIDGLHILIAPKDSGKTYSVIRPAVQRAKEQSDFPVGITPFISLSRGLSAKCAICNYLDLDKNQEILFLYDSLAVTVNSIIRPDFKNVLCKSKFTFADEIDQIYDAIAVGTVSKDKRKPVFDTLQGLLGSGKSITTSADIDDLCLENLLLTRKASEIVVYQANPAPVLSEKTVFVYDDHNVLVERLIADILSGMPVILACDSVKLANSVKKRLEKDGVSGVLSITKDTSQKEEIQDFVANVNDPEKGVKKLVLLIYTPSLQSGTSIDVPHFVKVYGVYHGQTTVDGFSQMLTRDRGSSEFHVAFKKSGQLPQEEINKRISEAIAEKLNASQKTYELVRDEHGHIQDVKLPALELSDFDRLRMETIERQAYERDPNELLRRLVAEGASVEYVSEDEATTKKAKDKITEINREIKAQDNAALIEAGQKITESLSVEEVAIRAQRIRAVGSVDEQALVLLDTYKTPAITEDILKFHDGGKGIRRIINLEKTLSANDDAVALDAVQLSELPVSLLDHWRLQQRFNRLLLRAIGLEFDEDFRPVEPEKVRFSAKSMEIVELVSRCYKYKQTFNGVMPIKVTAKSSRAPIVFVRNWLGTLGIKVVEVKRKKTKVSRGVRNYGLNLDALSLVTGVLTARKRQGQNWLKSRTNDMGVTTCSDHIYI